MPTIPNQPLNLERTLYKISASTKKSALEIISRSASEALENIAEQEILISLLERERLGSTNLGKGVALPHCKLEDLSESIAVFARLAEPVQFDGSNKDPVDLVYTLLVPKDATEEELTMLDDTAKSLRQKSLCDKLRHARSQKRLYELMSDHTNHSS